MNKILRLELKRAFGSKTFKISVLIGLILTIPQIFGNITTINRINDMTNSLGITASYSIKHYINNIYTSWLGYNMDGKTYMFFYVMPLLAVLPYGLSYCEDTRSGYIKNICTRCTMRRYVTAKYIATFLAGGCAVIIPIIVNFIGNAMVFPVIGVEMDAAIDTMCQFSWLSKLYLSHPLIYCMIKTMIIFVFYGGIATIALTVAMKTRQVFTVFAVPFIICMVEYFILGQVSLGNCAPFYFLQYYDKGFNYTIVVLHIAVVIIIPSALFIIGNLKKEVY